MYKIILFLYFTNFPQDGPHGKSTSQNMERGGDTTASSEILRKMALIILSYLKIALMYKKLPMRGAVYMSLYEVNSKQLYP